MTPPDLDALERDTRDPDGEPECAECHSPYSDRGDGDEPPFLCDPCAQTVVRALIAHARELRAKVANLRDAHVLVCEEVDEVAAMLRITERERDEARAEVARHLELQSVSHNSRMRERYKARARVVELGREIAAARAVVEAYRLLIRAYSDDDSVLKAYDAIARVKPHE